MSQRRMTTDGLGRREVLASGIVRILAFDSAPFSGIPASA